MACQQLAALPKKKKKMKKNFSFGMHFSWDSHEQWHDNNREQAWNDSQ